ncbi:MAG: alpha/beta fold hydrolase [Legionellales bacterium]
MKTGELDIPGLTIAYKMWGNPSNPPVLALHGWMDNANSFDGLAAILLNHYYVIAIDLPGHGHSSHLPLSSHYHFTDAICVVVQVIRALQLDKVHLLGHSMGACLGSLIGGVAPEYLLSLTLIEGLGPFSHPAETACQQLSNYLNYLIQDETKQSKGFAQLDLAAKARAIRGYVSLDIARILVARGVVHRDGSYYWRHDRRLLVPSPLRMTETQVLSCLEQIQVKTCLLWASDGFSFDSELMQRRVHAIKRLRVEHLEGGHHVHMEQPEAVAQLLADFMRRPN